MAEDNRVISPAGWSETSKGNLVLVGNISDRGHGNNDGFIIETDSLGNILKSKLIGEAGYD